MGIGKLICVGVRGTTPGEALLESDLAACRRAGVGGVILFDVDVPVWHRLQSEGVAAETARTRAVRNILTADQVRGLVTHIRERLGSGIFVGIDQEGGAVARLSPARGFAAEPTARRFAELDDAARRQAAAHQADQLADLGFDLNFAPCVDLDLDPHNEIIGTLGRSYGTEPDQVIACANVVLDAHAAAGVAACLKHFPGHGSSCGDTHRGAVDITATWQREAELAPYRALCQRPGVAVMAAHVIHRDLAGNSPASLSTQVIDGLLRTEIGFNGVVVTDSIDMLAIADHYSLGEAAVAAVVAGADLVVDALNLTERAEHPAPVLVDALQRAVTDGRIPGGVRRIDESLARLHRLWGQVGSGG